MTTGQEIPNVRTCVRVWSRREHGTAWTTDEETLAVAIGQAQEKVNAATRDMLELIAAAQRVGLGVKGGYRSEAEFPHLTQHVTLAQAKARIAAAEQALPRHSLLGETLPAELPATGAAVAEDVWHWADGGPTELDNLVLLCPSHHVMLHQSEWSVSIIGGMPMFHPPSWQQSAPLSNPLHRPDLISGRR